MMSLTYGINAGSLCKKSLISLLRDTSPALCIDTCRLLPCMHSKNVAKTELLCHCEQRKLKSLHRAYSLCPAQ